MRNMYWKRILSISIVLVFLACVGYKAIAHPTHWSDALVIGTTDRVTELSFANSWDFFTWHVLRNTTGALVKLDEQLYIEGDIAEYWDISPDVMEYTFYIRPGITFWDGEACDAFAVKWALERTLRLNGPEGMVCMIKRYIDSIEVIDDLTVKINLTMPDAIFLARITNHVAPALIYSPKSTPEHDFARGQYAGTGPYKLIEYVPDWYVKYAAYDGYYGAAPKTELVIEKLYSDASALRAALEAGDIDLAFRGLDRYNIEDLEKNSDIVVELFPPSPGIRYLLFNVTQPPVDNSLVRQAIAYAVDRDAIVEQVFDGSVDPIYTMVPMVDPPFFGAILVFPERDLEKAVELLNKACYYRGNPLDLNLWYTPKHYGTTEADVATVVAGSLEETGIINVTIQVLEWDTYVKAIQILSTQDVMWIPLWSMTDEMVIARYPCVKGAEMDITMDINISMIYKS